MQGDGSVFLDFGDGQAPSAAPCDVAWFEALAVPDLYRNHPFRCTGVHAVAGPRETTKRMEFLRQSLELGTAEYRWAFAPGIAPSLEELRSFGQMLKEPLQRFAYEFFWFWPMSYPNTDTDEALGFLETRQPEDAVMHWRQRVAEGDVVARHNLAVYFHLQAIAGERVWGARDEARDSTWREALAHWRVLVGSESFWEKIRARLVELAEPQLPVEVVPLMQEALPRILALINAQLLLGYVEKGDAERAGWHAEFLRTRHVAEGRRQLELCVRPIKRRLDAMLNEARRSVELAPETGLDVAQRLLDPSHKELQLIEMLDAQGGDGLCTLSQLLGDAALDCLVYYQRKTGDNAGCLPSFSQLLRLKVTPELKERIARARQIIESHFSADPWTVRDVAPDDAGELVITNGLESLIVGSRGVQLGEMLLVSERITGFRHGFVAATDGSDEMRPVVAWWSPECEIVLDETCYFPAEDSVRAKALYDEVVSASQKWLVPSLVARLADVVKNGETLHVDSTPLTQEGVMLSLRGTHLTEPQLVPYSLLDCSIRDGTLVLASKHNRMLIQKMDTASTWNAVIVPAIIEGLNNANSNAASA